MNQDYINKLESLKTGIYFADKKIKKVILVIKAYQNQQIPDEIPKLYFRDTQLYKYPKLLNVQSELMNLRQYLIENFGVWHVFSKKWLEDLKKYLKKRKVLEIMAGNAILSANLFKSHATDNLNWKNQDITKPNTWCEVEEIDAISAVKKYAKEYDIIILSWAPDTDEVDYQILKYLRNIGWKGDFIVIGEKNGATNSMKFWKEARLKKISKLNLNHKAFDFIIDAVYLAK